ncbi:MAG: hypothetical protein WCZ90_09030 [Melioribacteraceae bacterium]
MKKIVILFLALANLILSQGKDTKLSYEFLVKSKSYEIILNNSQDENGNMRGTLMGKNDGSQNGVASSLDSIFIKYSSLVKNKKTYLNGINNTLQPDDYVIDFNLHPKKIMNDSVNLTFNYVLFEKKGSISSNKYAYNISFYEKELTFPLNIATSFTLFDSFYPNSSIKLRLFWQKSAPYQPLLKKKLFNDFDAGTYNPDEIFNEANIKWLLERSVLPTTNLGLSLEWLRQSNDKIIFQRISSPLRLYKETIKTKETTKEAHFYSGLVSVPYTSYFEGEKFLDTLAQNIRDSQVRLCVAMTPIVKEKDIYTVDVLICQVTANTKFYTSKRVNLSVGEKVKIDILPLVSLKDYKLADAKNEAVRKPENTSHKDSIIISVLNE